jgi:hypothetical protein
MNDETLKAEYSFARAQNREAAGEQFHEAERIAKAHGLLLTRHTGTHYSLTKRNDFREIVWRLNIYPGNRRLWWDRNHGKPPFYLPFNLGQPWTLLDVVRAAVEAQEERERTATA